MPQVKTPKADQQLDHVIDLPDGRPITWGPLMAVAFTVIMYFLSQFLGSLIILGIANGKGWTADQIEQWVDQTNVQFFYVLIVEATTLGLLAIFLKTHRASFKTLGLTKPQWVDAAYALIGFGMYFPIVIISSLVMKQWFPQIDLDQQQQIGFESARGAALILVFASLVILPPVTEEIVTRGFLFLGLKSKLPLFAAATITSLIFAMAHLQFGSGAPLLWSAAIDTFILSLVLIFLRQKTGRLWAPIGLHMLKNGLAFAALFIFVR